MTRPRFGVPSPTDPADAWYDSEPSARLGMVTELQRIKRRTLNRPLPVIALAALITFAITWRIGHHTPATEAEIVVAISEGALADRQNPMPVAEMIGYVTSILMPDTALKAMIERRDLFPKRHQLGDQFAIDELREQVSIQIYRNSFLYADAEDDNVERSVRIGITVTDVNPDRAFDLARDLAGIVVATSEARTQQVADQVTREVTQLRDGFEARLEDTTRALIGKRIALAAALEGHQDALAAGLAIDVSSLEHEQKVYQASLDKVVVSRDLIADRISAAGLDSTVQIVEERRPQRPGKQAFVIAMIASIAGVASLLAAAILIGAFDNRIHDSDDVERLGLPILGHVPGFPGDQVGSLQARGAARARVPSFLRWRSHR